MPRDSAIDNGATPGNTLHGWGGAALSTLRKVAWRRGLLRAFALLYALWLLQLLDPDVRARVWSTVVGCNPYADILAGRTPCPAPDWSAVAALFLGPLLLPLCAALARVAWRTACVPLRWVWRGFLPD